MTKAERLCVWYNDTEKDENKGATLCEKKWQEVAPDDNNNNNKCEATIHSSFHTSFHNL